jgi:hypothetical protein
LTARVFLNVRTTAATIGNANFASWTDPLKKEASNFALRLSQAVGHFILWLLVVPLNRAAEVASQLFEKVSLRKPRAF